MKATDLLESQHRSVESLFSKAESGDDDALGELTNILVAHMTIEQEVFYPAVRFAATKQIAESFEEHAVAELALKRLLATERHDESFTARLTVLRDLIEHHVEEEENELFPAVEKAVAEDDLEGLAERMKELFDDVMAADDDKKLPRGFDETSADRAQRSRARQSDAAGKKSQRARRTMNRRGKAKRAKAERRSRKSIRASRSRQGATRSSR